MIELSSKRCPECQTQNKNVKKAKKIACYECKTEFCWLCAGDYYSHVKDVEEPENPLEETKESAIHVEETKDPFCSKYTDVNEAGKEKNNALYHIFKEEQALKRKVFFEKQYNEH